MIESLFHSKSRKDDIMNNRIEGFLVPNVPFVPIVPTRTTLLGTLGTLGTIGTNGTIIL
jgi:hypothetical protein